MTAQRLAMSDLAWATELLTSAFENIAPATRLFTGTGSRAKLSYFMKCGCKYALLYGECYATEGREAVALWLLPGATHMTPARMFRAGMFAAPIRFGMRDFKAFGAFVGHTDRAHREVVSEPHYYLLTLGVAPGSQGTGAGGRLLRPMLERARNERTSVYLETQRPENVPIYERFGFRVASDEPIAEAGLRNWGMLKREHA